MIFASPIWLIGLLPVTVMAVAAFVRPSRREITVGSLALWQAAAQSLGGTGEKNTRRIPPGWVLLFLGAVLTILALAQPMLLHATMGPETTGASSLPKPTITFDALAGEIRPDGKAELFVRLRNHTDQPFTGSLTITSRDATSVEAIPMTIEPGQTWQKILPAPDSPSLRIEVLNRENTPVASAKVHKTRPGLTRIATMGNVSPALHRYIQADVRLTLVGDPNEADVILAQGTIPPPKTPALVLAPPTNRLGWRDSEPTFAVTLAQSDVASDDPVMKDVNVAAMAIRRMKPWVNNPAIGNILLQRNNQAIIVRSTPEIQADGHIPRRVYIAFAITADNTNINHVPAPYVTLLANAIRWLHPVGEARGKYVCDSGMSGTFNHRSDEIGTMVVGALAERETAPTSEETRLKVPLNIELGPWFIVAAMLCWLLGWWRSGRRAV